MIYTTLQQNNQSGIAIAQNTDADNNFTVPDRSLNIQKLSLTCINELLNFTAVVGQAQDVSNGTAQYTSIQAAVTAVGSGGRVLILPGTYTESLTIATDNIFIQGQGYGCHLSGALTLSNNYCDLNSFRVTGNISATGGKNFVKLWQDSGFTITDTGTDNNLVVIQG
jgi:pectin methylesterase-like acyl-CoA thioesterase